MFEFLLEKYQVSGARAGTLITPRGKITTPRFMPVGTLANVKGITFDQLKQINPPIILANTYHLYLRPGHELVEKMGGIHAFMGWDGPVLTDSGGFQVFSLSKLSKIDETGYHFQSHIDGSRHQFTPTKVLDIQKSLGSDIIMPLDECLEFNEDEERISASVDLTLQWAAEQRDYYEKNLDHRSQALFGIVQGAGSLSQRERCAVALEKMDFFGYSIGGLSVGESKTEMYEFTKHVTQFLPEKKPRYLMGVGSPEDLLEGVAHGVDMFDCVMATRNARNASVFTRSGKLNLRNATHAESVLPIEENCSCYTCRNHSRAYLRHLFKADEMNGPILATIHNLHFFQVFMNDMRDSILKGAFSEFRDRFYSDYAHAEKPGYMEGQE